MSTTTADQPPRVTFPVPTIELQRFAKETLQTLGERGAARELGVNRTALCRVAAGLTVRAGTLALLREARARLASTPGDAR